MPPAFLLGVLAWDVIVRLASGRTAFDLQRWPDTQALEVIRQSGWAAAADDLESQLADI